MLFVITTNVYKTNIYITKYVSIFYDKLHDETFIVINYVLVYFNIDVISSFMVYDGNIPHGMSS